MAKNRNKKNKNNNGETSMDTSNITVTDLPQAMDTSETGPSSLTRKVKKGVQMKRTKNTRKKKAIAKAISKSEKAEEKVTKLENKKTRVHSAKSLYD